MFAESVKVYTPPVGLVMLNSLQPQAEPLMWTGGTQVPARRLLVSIVTCMSIVPWAGKVMPAAVIAALAPAGTSKLPLLPIHTQPPPDGSGLVASRRP